MLKKCILWFFVIVVSIQIFSFSGENGQMSDGTSKKVTAAVVEIVKKLVIFPNKRNEACLNFATRLFERQRIFPNLCYWQCLLRLYAEAIA